MLCAIEDFNCDYTMHEPGSTKIWIILYHATMCHSDWIITVVKSHFTTAGSGKMGP